MTGQGAAVVLILDEVRQMITDLLLSSSGPRTLWETPAERWRAGWLWRSIAAAGVVLAMDAQAGEPERELLRGISRREAARVLGCPPVEPTRMMRWTSQQSRWRDCLLGHSKARSATDKPLLVVTGAKGKDGQGLRGLSARACVMRCWKRCRPYGCLSSMPKAKQRWVLRGDVEDWDVVICTPVAQSGVSWVGVFAETVFVAGGRTLPPNICGGQRVGAKRTATTCVAYVPKTAWDRSLPLMGREVEAIRQELRQAREQAAPAVAVAGRSSCWSGSTCWQPSAKSKN